MRYRRHGYRGQSRAISQQLPVNSTVRPCPPLGLSYQASATIKGVTSTARTVQAKRVIRAVENAHEQTRHLETCQTRSARSAIAANPSPPLLDVPANLVTEKLDRSPSARSTSRSAMLVRSLPGRANTRTDSLRASKARAMAEPMKPVAPVTRVVMTFSLVPGAHRRDRDVEGGWTIAASCRHGNTRGIRRREPVRENRRPATSTPGTGRRDHRRAPGYSWRPVRFRLHCH